MSINVEFKVVKLERTTGGNNDLSGYAEFDGNRTKTKHWRKNDSSVGPYTFSTDKVDPREVDNSIEYPGIPYAIPIQFKAWDRDPSWDKDSTPDRSDELLDLMLEDKHQNLDLLWDLEKRILIGEVRGNSSEGRGEGGGTVATRIEFNVASDPFVFDKVEVSPPDRRIELGTNAIIFDYTITNPVENTFAITSWNIPEPEFYQTEFKQALVPGDEALKLTPFIISENLANAYPYNVVTSLRNVGSTVEFDDYYSRSQEVRVATPALGASSSVSSLKKSIAIPETQPILLDRIGLNFETDAFGNSLDAGETITDQYSELGLSIISGRRKSSSISSSIIRGNPMIFDSENPTGGDFDLETTNQGNVLIVSQDDDSSNPNDNNTQSFFRFDWNHPVSIDQIGLLDIDADESVTVTTVDANHRQINQHHIEVGEGAGNNQLQDLIIGDEGVYGMVVKLSRSGAITNVLYAPDNSVSNGTSSLDSVEIDTDHDILIGSVQNDTMSNPNPNTEQLVAGTDESLLIPEYNSTLAVMDQESIIELETDLVDDVMMTDSTSVTIPNDEPMVDYMSDIPGVDPENSNFSVV